jgi:hypothetical protein
LEHGQGYILAASNVVNKVLARPDGAAGLITADISYTVRGTSMQTHPAVPYFPAFAIYFFRAMFKRFWIITGALFLATVIGWYQYLLATPLNHASGGQHTIWDAIVLTIMVAPLRAPVVYGPDVPILLNLGRVLLPFLFVGGIFKLTTLRDETEQWVSKLFAHKFLWDHAVG